MKEARKWGGLIVRFLEKGFKLILTTESESLLSGGERKGHFRLK